jgi:hypothetical protein
MDQRRTHVGVVASDVSCSATTDRGYIVLVTKQDWIRDKLCPGHLRAKDFLRARVGGRTVTDSGIRPLHFCRSAS